MSKRKFEERDYNARYDIRAPIAREIGRFIVTWAHFEHWIQLIIWRSILNMSDAEGRIAVRDPRVSKRLDMVRDLCQLKKKEIDYVLLASIKTRAKPLATMRHLLAHTIWTLNHDQWFALVTRGAWDTHLDVADFPKDLKLKSVLPEGIRITPELIQGWTKETARLITDLRRIGDNHTVVPKPSQRTHRKRSVQATPKKGRGG
jgi:hypothetical protein